MIIIPWSHLNSATDRYGTLDKDHISSISAKSLQLIKDKPRGWEHLLFAELLNDYMKECENIKRDLVYGKPLREKIVLDNPIQIVNWVQEHVIRLQSIVNFMTRLINEDYPRAIGKEEQSGDARHIHYIAKNIIDEYKNIIEWRLEFLSLDVDQTFNKLLNLTSHLASNATKEIEEFVIRFHKETNKIYYNPEEEGVLRFSIDLGIPDSSEFREEIQRLINMSEEERLNANVVKDVSKVCEEIERLTKMINDKGLNASVVKDVSKVSEEMERLTKMINEKGIKTSVADNVFKLAKEFRRFNKVILGKDVTPAYKIVDGHTYENAVRIRTKWKGKNRLLWIEKTAIDEFLAHPENFKEIPKLFDSGKLPHETRGRIKMGPGGTVLRWNACLVKRGEGCFIATAVYDSASASEVVYLRNFRDKILLPNLIGRLLVTFYYQMSPPISGFISRHIILKRLVRVFFTDPVIGCIKVFWQGGREGLTSAALIKRNEEMSNNLPPG